MADTNKSSARSVEQAQGIDIFRILSTLRKKWYAVAAMAVIFGVVGFVSSLLTYVPTYQADCSFFILFNTNGVGSSMINSNDIYAGSAVADVFTAIAQSRDMKSDAVQKLKDQGINVDYFPATMLVERTSSSIIKTTFISNTPEMAQAVCTAFSEVFMVKAPEIVGGDNCTISALDKPLATMNPIVNSTKRSYTAIGAIIGALLAAVFLFLTDHFRNTVQTSADLQNKLDLNIIGSVPMVIRPGMKKGQLPKGLLVNDSTSGFTFIETYKSIRTKIETLADKNNYKKFLISSTLENEGKTTVAANIAISLAQNGKSVLLIDGDLRKPAVHKLLSVKRSSKIGMLPILRGEATWQESIKYVDQMGIFILHSGSSSENSAEYLSSQRMEDLMHTIQDEFDYIIIDSPPTSMVTDSAIISGYCDAVILVVKQDVARIPDISRAVQDLGERGTPVIGCVYNVVESGAGGYGYGKKYYKKYYKSYGKSYGKGYGYGGYGYGGYGYGERHEEKEQESDADENE